MSNHLIKYSIISLLSDYSKGHISDGEIFQLGSGERVTFLDNCLKWVTLSNAVTSPVPVTKELLSDSFVSLERAEQSVDFVRAIELLCGGQELTAHIPERAGVVFRVNSIPILREFMQTYGVEMSSVASAVDFYMVSQVNTPKDSKEAQGGTERQKLSLEDAYNLIYQYHKNDVSVPDLARQYDISTRMVYYILEGVYWSQALHRFKDDYNM